MFSVRRCYAVFTARNREFFRDRGSFIWALAFPVLLVFIFSFAFSNESSQLPVMGLLSPISENVDFDENQVTVVEVDTLEEGQEKLREFSIDILYAPASGDYWLNSESRDANSVEKILWGMFVQKPSKLTRHEVEGEIIPYVHWLFPGLLGMNVMFSALIGVGFVIVRYRRNGVLRRFKATPLRPIEFICAQVFSRLAVISIVTLIIYLGLHFSLGIGTVKGSVFALILVFYIGILAIVALGLIIGSRIRSEELSGGILNLISFPMMLLSGVWFSLERLHPWAQGFANIFPLKHILEAARNIMLYGASFAEVLPQLGILAGMMLVFFSVAALLFRWE